MEVLDNGIQTIFSGEDKWLLSNLNTEDCKKNNNNKLKDKRRRYIFCDRGQWCNITNSKVQSYLKG